MTRYKRELSKTGIYHVMTRGNNKSKIFLDNRDMEKYLQILLDKKQDKNYYLFAYCIMPNHSHLIIKEEEQLSTIMKKINISYAQYFNKKYDKVGHVFQDRYRSEPIEDDRYLLTAVRYVHNNPIKAKIVADCKDYPWSSYNYYIGKCDDNLVDTDFVLAIFSPVAKDSVRMFEEFSKEYNDDKFIDIQKEDEEIDILGQKAAKAFIIDYLDNENLKIEDLKNPVYKKKRNRLILYLRRNSNLSIRELANVLELGRGTIVSVCSSKK